MCSFHHGSAGLRSPTTATNMKAALIVQCSKKALSCIVRASPENSQKRCASKVAHTVNTPSAPAPSHTHLLAITSADPASCVKRAAQLKAAAGRRPTCTISATPAGQSTSFVSPPTINGAVTMIRAIRRVAGLSSKRMMTRGVSARLSVVGKALIAMPPSRRNRARPRRISYPRSADSRSMPSRGHGRAACIDVRIRRKR